MPAQLVLPSVGRCNAELDTGRSIRGSAWVKRLVGHWVGSGSNFRQVWRVGSGRVQFFQVHYIFNIFPSSCSARTRLSLTAVRPTSEIAHRQRFTQTVADRTADR